MYFQMLTRCLIGGMGEYFDVIESEVQKKMSKFGIEVVIWGDQFDFNFEHLNLPNPPYPITKNIFWTDSIASQYFSPLSKNWNFS